MQQPLMPVPVPVAALVAALVLAVNGVAQELGTVPKHAPSTKAPKGEVLEWTSRAGRPYWYRVPKKSKGKPALILMLHGTGGNHGWSFWNYPIVKGVKAEARAEHATLLKAWQGLTKTGRAAAAALDGELAKAFREKHPKWFE